MLFRVPYYLLRVRAVRELSRLCRRGRNLVLTYDDGPGRRLSRALVGLLGSRGARATFFVLGRRVVEDGETVDVVRAAGHELGVHSFDNRNAWQGPGAAVKDIAAGYAAAALFSTPATTTNKPMKITKRLKSILVYILLGLTRRVTSRKAAPAVAANARSMPLT